MNSLPFFHVDAFTGKPFAGNPACVCLLDEPRPDAWMQSLAAEMNLSETAFLLTEGDGYRLRWFTPKVEVSLCGHATLASAHILYETGRLAPGEIARFYTRSGLLTACLEDGWIALNFPVAPVEPAQAPAGLLEALGVEKPVFTGKKITAASYLIEVQDEQTVRSLSPDFPALLKVEARGITVTARSQDPSTDFVSRYFAPRVGINEDPVTGSAHCLLAPYWSDKLGKTALTAYQASARGGTLRLRCEGERVVICSQAVTVFSAKLHA